MNLPSLLSSAFFLHYPVSTLTPSHKTTTFDRRHSRLRREDSVEDALPPVLVLEQEDILDNGGQAGFREGTIQASFQERRPFPLQRPLATHIPLNADRHGVMGARRLPFTVTVSPKAALFTRHSR